MVILTLKALYFGNRQRAAGADFSLKIRDRRRDYLASSETIFDEMFERQQIAVSPEVNGAHLLMGAKVANRVGIGEARKIEAAFRPSSVEFWIALKGATDELRRISFIK